MKHIITLLAMLSIFHSHARNIIKSTLDERKNITGLPVMPLQDIDGCHSSGIQYIVDGIAVTSVACPMPCIYPDFAPTDYKLDSEEISHMPVSMINDLVSIFPGIYQARRGDALHIYGSRADGISYYIDGVRAD